MGHHKSNSGRGFLKISPSPISKDFHMEIRKTRGRFLSILFIVALGVAFFSGIRASEPDMRYSGDEYLDEKTFMDGNVLCTMGLTDSDVEAISKVDGVESVEPAYSGDVIWQQGDSEKVLHLMSTTSKLNELTVTEGRLPKKADECFVDAALMTESKLKIGDSLTFKSGNEDNIEDTLTNTTYTIVGAGHSPSYISYTRGSSLIGTGQVSGFMYLAPSGFSQEVYSEIFLRVKGASKEVAFTDGYQNRVDDVMDRVEEIADKRCVARKAEIVDEANEKIIEGEQKLTDAKTEAETELADAQKKLEDAKKQLENAKQQVTDGKAQIAVAKKTLHSKQKELDQGQSEYDSGIKQWETGKAEYDKNQVEFMSTYDTNKGQIQEGLNQIAEAGTLLDAERAKLEAMIQDTSGEVSEEQKAQAKAELQGLEQQQTGLNVQKQDLESKLAQLEAGKQQLDQAKQQLDSTKNQLDSAKVKLDGGRQQIKEGWSTLKAQESKLEDAMGQITTGEQEYNDGLKSYENGKKEADEKIADAEEELDNAKEKVADMDEPEWYVYSREHNADYTGYGDNADRMRAIGRVFPILFFLVAALISLTSMTRMVEEQRMQIGTLKALGYGKYAIAKKYIYYALLATILGSVLGILVGEKVIPFVIVFSYKIMYESVPNIVIPYNMYYGLMATAVAVLCTTLATVFACYKELAAVPAKLMRPPSPKNGKRILLERITILWKHMSFTWKSTMRNLIRYKKRFFMTIFGIGGCMALMIVGFGLKDSIYEIVNLQYDDIQLYDESIYLQDNITQEQRQDITRALNQNAQIEGFTDLYVKSVGASNGNKFRDVYMCVPKDTTEIDDFVKFQGRLSRNKYHITNDGAILTEKAAKLLGVKAGDSLTVKIGNGKQVTIRIVQICENYLGHFLYMSPEMYEKLAGEPAEYNCIYVEDGNVTRTERRKIGEDILKQDGVLNVSYTDTNKDQLDDMLGSLNTVIIVLIVSAGMLAFVVLYNLNNVNISERKRELATIKVLGFFDLEVAEYVYRENALLTVIGCFVGLILGRLLHAYTIVTVEIDNCMFGRDIAWTSYLYSALFTILFAVIVNFVTYFKLKRIDMIESLKSVE